VSLQRVGQGGLPFLAEVVMPRVAAGVLAGVLVVSFSAWAAEKKAPSPQEVQKLIGRLGDDDPAVRKESAAALEALGESVLPALEEVAKKAGDADVRLRAAVAASAIRKKLYGPLRTFTGHNGWVFRVVMLPGGKQAVSSGDYLRVWDLETGKELRRFAPGVGAWGLSVSRDGRHVLASHADRSVRLYEVQTGKELRRFVGHTGEVWAAGLSPDGKTAVTGAFDNTIHVWDATTGKKRLSFAGMVDLPRCLAWSPDGKRVAVGHFQAGDFATARSTVRVWDVETGKQVAAGAGHTGAITAVDWSKDGKRLVTSSFDKTLRVWDATTGRQLKCITASPEGCDGVAWTPDGKWVVSTGWGKDWAVRVHDAQTGKERVRFDGHTASALCVCVTPDGKRALSSGIDGTLRLWRLRE
jgi:WD40 repeat protein